MAFHSFIEKYDSGIISAFRTSATNCVGGDIGLILNENDNKSRNKHLIATLMFLGYGIVRIKGTCVDFFLSNNRIVVKEDSYFVVNLSNDPMFIKNMKKLGQLFCQDSVLIIERGGNHNYFVGTNNSVFPGFGEVVSVGTFKPEIEQDLIESENRPFTLDTFSSVQINSKRVVYEFAKPVIDLLQT
jgi:hypothetical protein